MANSSVYPCVISNKYLLFCREKLLRSTLRFALTLYISVGESGSRQYQAFHPMTVVYLYLSRTLSYLCLFCSSGYGTHIFLLSNFSRYFMHFDTLIIHIKNHFVVTVVVCTVYSKHLGGRGGRMVSLKPLRVNIIRLFFTPQTST